MWKSARLRKKSTAIIFWIFFPFLVSGILFAAKTLYVRWLMPYVPSCVIRTLTGWKCPSCGMTHAVLALCRGDIRGTARENVMLLVGLIFLVLWYIERWLRIFDADKKIIPKTSKFWLGVLGMWLVYTVLRNIG